MGIAGRIGIIAVIVALAVMFGLYASCEDLGLVLAVTDVIVSIAIVVVIVTMVVLVWYLLKVAPKS